VLGDTKDVPVDWSTLSHAYGSASDVPAMLADLSPDPQASVWHEIWSRLCHQGTVYSASFAALPVLANVAEQWKPKDRCQLLTLAADILASEDVSRVRREEFVRPIQSVIPQFQRFCQESLAATDVSKHDFIYLLQAARSFEGDRFWGQKLDYLASGEFPGECPHCGVGLYLVIGDHGFFTTAEEWVQGLGTKSGKIEPRPEIHRTAIQPNSGVLPDVGQWLYERAETAQQMEVASWIRHVFGTSVCPSCDHAFKVQDAIARQ
jgi:hypothetical protein